MILTLIQGALNASRRGNGMWIYLSVRLHMVAFHQRICHVKEYHGIKTSVTMSPREKVLFSVQELLIKPVIVRICYLSLSKSMFQNDCNLKSPSKRTLGRHHKAVFIPWLLNCTTCITIQEKTVLSSPSCVPYLSEAVGLSLCSISCSWAEGKLQYRINPA